MKAILLAAGLGTRLRGTVGRVPKILVPVAGRPLLERQLAYLAEQGITEVGVNLHHRADDVLAFLDASAPPVPVRVSVEPELLGTAGALHGFATMLDEPFVVLYGDVVTDIDLRALRRAHDATDAAATLACSWTTEVEGKGLLDVDADGQVTGFVEKGGGVEAGYVNAGVHVLEPRVLGYVPPGRSDFGFDVWPALLAAGEALLAYVTSAYVCDVGTPEALARASRDLAARERRGTRAL